MGQAVQTFKKETIQKMKHYYKQVINDKPPAGAVFRARTDNAVITAYNSGKVLFQGSNPEIEYKKWSNDVNTTNQKRKPIAKQSNITNFHPPQTLFTETHIGSDESGTGDYFGPVTTSAAYINKEQIAELKKLGITDSKQITDQNVMYLSNELAKLNIPSSLIVLHNEKYNSLQKQGWSQGKMKAMLHHHAINKLLTKIKNRPYDGILIDQFCQPDLYVRYIASENESLPDKTFFMTKAESYSIAVAAGSVIARASFLNEMDKLSAQVGYSLLKGASQHVDALIAQIIREQGEAILNTCAKLHFANTKKARKLV